MNRKAIFIVAIILVAGTGFILFQQKQIDVPQNGSPTANALGRIFELKLQDYDGNTVMLSDFKGKPLVINSWASWCPFCRKELPDFAAVQDELKNELVIIAIDRAESTQTAKQYSDSLGATGLTFLLDPSDAFYKAIDGFAMPETIIVDKNGVVRDHKRGPMDAEELRERIKKIL